MKKKLTVEHIAKVEGHGKLAINIKDGSVESVKLEIFEGARYFENLVKNRNYAEAPAITSRICGICSQSHLLCAIQAIESAFKTKVSKQTKQLRKLIMLGSLIQSHILHLYFLCLPEYLGFSSAIDMSKKYKDEVKRALRLKKFANKIVTIIGGREIHSIRPIIGGFTKLPTQDELDELLSEFNTLDKDFEKTVELFLGIDYPEYQNKTDYLTITDKNDVDYLSGNLLSLNNVKGLQKNYQKYITEKVVDYSNTKLVSLNNEPYMVGPLARFNVNYKKFSLRVRKAIKKYKLTYPDYNPYHNNQARAIEILEFVEQSKNILKDLKIKPEELTKITPKAGVGVSIIEAPRGLLIHEYKIDSSGKISKANIIAPTTQNLYNIEKDAKIIITDMLNNTNSEKKILQTVEKLIRAYDPCISCSTHFLELVWNKK
jgi:sulfhydrogenase subunit alpha